jgi:hypothetical protein
MDIGSSAHYDWAWIGGELNQREDDVNSALPGQNFSPWTDGSSLRAVSIDPFYPYVDGSIDVGINQETLEEAIRRVISEEFRKAGIGIDSDRYVTTMDLARIEKYKMKHR